VSTVVILRRHCCASLVVVNFAVDFIVVVVVFSSSPSWPCCCCYYPGFGVGVVAPRVKIRHSSERHIQLLSYTASPTYIHTNIYRYILYTYVYGLYGFLLLLLLYCICGSRQLANYLRCHHLCILICPGNNNMTNSTISGEIGTYMRPFAITN